MSVQRPTECLIEIIIILPPISNSAPFGVVSNYTNRRLDLPKRINRQAHRKRPSLLDFDLVDRMSSKLIRRNMTAVSLVVKICLPILERGPFSCFYVFSQGTTGRNCAFVALATGNEIIETRI